MAKEFEKKYLCKFKPSECNDIPALITQGYIHVDKQKQVRVRIIQSMTETSANLCVKFNRDGHREEYEAPLTPVDAVKIVKDCIYFVQKYRWSIQFDGYHIDIDEYKNGTVIAEVEYEEGKEPKTLPDFIGKCVDGDYSYTNFHFAGIKEEHTQ